MRRDRSEFWWGPVLGSLALAACGEAPEFPQPPPEQVLAGPHHLLTAPSRPDELFVVALRDPVDDLGTPVGTLVVRRLGGDGCEAGRAAYASALGRRLSGDDVDVRLVVLDPFPPGGPFPFRFLDLDCRETRPPVLLGTLPGVHTVDGEVILSALDDGGSLVFVSPFEDGVRRVAPRAAAHALVPQAPTDWMRDTLYPSRTAPRPWVFAVEGSQLVVRDPSGGELVRLGAGVRRIAQSRAWVAFEDDRGLWAVSSASPAEAELLLEGPCEGWALDPTGQVLRARTACDGGDVVAFDLPAGERTVVAEGVDELWWANRGWVGYRVAADGQRWLVSPGGEARPVEGQPRPITDLGGPGWLIREEGIDLIAPDASRRQLMARVGAWALTSFDGGARLMPAVTDVDGELGTLSVLDTRSFAVETFARGVDVGSFRFFDPPHASQLAVVGYLRDWVAGEGGTLELLLLPDRVAIDLAEGVTRFRPVIHGPRPGLLFTVEAGPRAGIWIADQ